jgi:hypothetical protein
MKNLASALTPSLKNLAAYPDLRFTRRQLYYETCRTAKQPKGFDAKTAAVVFAAGSLPAVAALAARRAKTLATGLITANALAAVGLTQLRRAPHTLAPPFSWEHFESSLTEYLKNDVRPAGLLEMKTENLTNAPVSHPADLTLYGLPRLLVCESPEIAEMLRANRFHMEAACAVLSFAEAAAATTTAPLAETFKEMLARAPHPRVFFLHDAAAEAYEKIRNLRARIGLPDAVQLTVLGLRPVHAARLHLFATRDARGSIDDFDSGAFLSEDENGWLAAGWRAEVAAVHPVRLLRVLRRLVLDLPAPVSVWRLRLPPRALGFMS